MSNVRLMIRLFAILLALVPTLSLADISVDGGVFSLRLEGDWVQTSFNRHENQYCFVSKDRNAQLTVSGFAINVRPGTLDSLGEATLRFVVNREQKEHSRGRGTIERQWIVPLADVRQLNYVGHDTTQRSFRYAGYVSEKKVVSVYLEMPTEAAIASDEVLSSVLKNLRRRQDGV